MMIIPAKTRALLMAICASLPFGLDAAAQSPSAQPTLPNLLPQSPSSAPLLRKVNVKAATMIPSFYCAGISEDQVVEVQVPPFDWGVANDDHAAVEGPFSVSLLSGATNRVLSTQSLQGIARSGSRIFRNWPSRPTRVKVIKVTGSNPKLSSEYDSTPGCYIPTALAGSVVLDPKPLIIRVDDSGKIAERIENDNDLTR